MDIGEILLENWGISLTGIIGVLGTIKIVISTVKSSIGKGFDFLKTSADAKQDETKTKLEELETARTDKLAQLAIDKEISELNVKRTIAEGEARDIIDARLEVLKYEK